MPYDRAECRQKAEQCRWEAEQSDDQEDKAYWLKIAEGWSVLALTEEEPARISSVIPADEAGMLRRGS